jgi:pre-mRNA-processing factor 17
MTSTQLVSPMDLSEEEYRRLNKTRPKKTKLRREEFGDPSEIGGYRGPWAKYTGIEDKARNNTASLERVVNKHCLEENRERCRRNVPYSMSGYGSLDRCMTSRCTIPASNTMLFHEHRDAVSSVRLFRKHDLLLSASRDGKAILYSLRGEVLSVFMGHSKAVTSAALTREEETFSTASYDGLIKQWSVEKGRCTVRVDCGSPLVCQAEESGSCIVASLDGKIQRVDFRSRGAVKIAEDREGACSLCIIGEMLGYTGVDGRLCLLDLRTGRLIKEHSGAYNSLDYSEKQSRVAAGSPTLVKIFDAPGLEPTGTEYEIGGCTAGIRYSPDGRHLCYGSRDGGICSAGCKDAIGFSNAEIRAVDWAPGDSVNFASGDALGFVKTWK